MELKRIFINKRILISIIAVLAVSLGFFINTQFNNASAQSIDLNYADNYRNELLDKLREKSVEDAEIYTEQELTFYSTINSLINFDSIKTDNYEEYTEIWLENEIYVRNSYPEIAKEYDANKSNYEFTEINSKCYVLSELTSQLEYIDSYPDYLESIDSQAEQMKKFSIFSDADSLSDQNIENTVNDYSELKNITLNIGNDEPIETVIDFELIHYLTLLFCVVIIFSFNEERKRGLWNVVYAAANGRFTLALKRIFCLFISVVLIDVISYIALFAASFTLYGGTEDLFRNIQSIEAFQNFVFPMNELQFIIFYLIINICVQFAISLIIWLCVSISGNIGISIGLIGIIFAVEYVMYSVLPEQSNIAVVKYVNLFYLLNPTSAIIKYNNINFFFTVINLFLLLIISTVLLILIFVFLNLYVNSKNRPEKSPNKLEITADKAIQKIKNLYWSAIEKIGVLGTEIYKLLIMQKGIIVIICLSVAVFSLIDTSPIYYSGSDAIAKQFYENYGGELSESAINYVTELEEEINQVDEEFEQKVNDYANNKISSDEFENANLKYGAFDNKREALKKIKNKIEYIENENSQGTAAWIVDDEGYIELLGENGFSRQNTYSLLSVFCIVIIMSGVFAFEKKSLMYNSLHTSYKGRDWLFRKKILSAAIITALIFAVLTAAELYEIINRYGLSQLGAPIKSLEFMSSLPFNMNIITFLILMYVARYIMLISISYLVCLCSALFKYEISMAVSAFIFVVPSLLYFAGIEFLSYISLCIPISAMELVLNSDGLTFLIPMMLTVVSGAIGLELSRRVWRKS